MADSDSTSPDKKRQEPPPIEFVKPGEEQPTQPPPQRSAAAWVTRPEDYQRPQYAQGPAPPRTQPQGTGSRPRLAGILLFAAAASSVGGILYSIYPPAPVSQYAAYINDTSLYLLSQVCSIMVTWGQAIVVLAGIMAYQRINWRMAVGCAFFSVILLGAFAVATLDLVAISASLLGLAGFVLAVVSRQEFRS